MNHSLQIQKLLVQASSIPYPREVVKFLKEAINIADANNDINWGYDLRKQIISEEKYTSSCIESLPAFTWILETYEQYPDLCAESDFLTTYQWMIQVAGRNADISMAQYDSIIEDYKMRLQRNGYSLNSYYGVKVKMAFLQKNLAEAKKYLDLQKSEERDALSMCRTCELQDLAEYAFLTGDIMHAFEIGLDLFMQKEQCEYAPFQIICNNLNLFYLLRYHRGFEALLPASEKLFSMVESMLDRTPNINMSSIGYIGKLIHYLTRSDKNRAWIFFEKYLTWSINCEDYYNFMFSSWVLSLFKGSGTHALNVSPEIPWYKSSGVYELPDLYDYYRNQAETLAIKFDARNGNTGFINELNSMD
jgi:hypothetical protein